MTVWPELASIKPEMLSGGLFDRWVLAVERPRPTSKGEVPMYASAQSPIPFMSLPDPHQPTDGKQ